MTDSPPLSTASDRDDILSLVDRAFDTFNTGDFEGFLSTWAADVDAIINEAPPHVWTGPDCVQAWLADSAKRPGAAELTEPRIVGHAPDRLEIAGDRAFLVLPVTMSFTSAGGRVERYGTQISVLRRGSEGWRVKSLAYGSRAGA